MKVYEELETMKLEDNFLKLQKNMECSMLQEGNNDYREPHLGTKKRRRAVEVIGNLICSKEAFEKATEIAYAPAHDGYG